MNRRSACGVMPTFFQGQRALFRSIRISAGRLRPMTQAKLLVVDNDSSTVELFSDQRISAYLDTQCVGSSDESLPFLDQWHPDIVMANGLMARQNDFALIQILQDRQKDQKPVIVISSFPTDGSLVDFRLRFNLQYFLQKPLDPETLAKTLLGFASLPIDGEPSDTPPVEGIDLQFDPDRARRNVLDVDMDDDFLKSLEESEQESFSQDLKDTMGVFSTNKPVVIGYGTTTRKIRVKEYWYVVRNGDNFSAQAINNVHVPTGEKFNISKEDLFSNYDPEMDYMYKKLLPAMQNLERTLSKGDRHRSRMEHFSAEMEYNEALRIDTDNVRATFGLGLTYLELQDSKKADAVFKSLINLDAAFGEDHKHLFNEFGIQLRKNKMFNHAVQYYDRARELSKQDENIFFNLARAWYEKGDWGNCLRNLVICLTMNKQLEEAQRFSKHILSLSLDNELCKEHNKGTLQTPSSRYDSLLAELRNVSGLSDEDWKTMQQEVAEEKKKQKRATARKRTARKKNEQRSESAPNETSKKKSEGQAGGGKTEKYVMPF